MKLIYLCVRVREFVVHVWETKYYVLRTFNLFIIVIVFCVREIMIFLSYIQYSFHRIFYQLFSKYLLIVIIYITFFI